MYEFKLVTHLTVLHIIFTCCKLLFNYVHCKYQLLIKPVKIFIGLFIDFDTYCFLLTIFLQENCLKEKYTKKKIPLDKFPSSSLNILGSTKRVTNRLNQKGHYQCEQKRGGHDVPVGYFYQLSVISGLLQYSQTMAYLMICCGVIGPRESSFDAYQDIPTTDNNYVQDIDIILYYNHINSCSLVDNQINNISFFKFEYNMQLQYTVIPHQTDKVDIGYTRKKTKLSVRLYQSSSKIYQILEVLYPNHHRHSLISNELCITIDKYEYNPYSSADVGSKKKTLLQYKYSCDHIKPL
ncbi:hypothetical protein AGLY_003536 [Aphis glycines]|uniref:Uncharacterized protein n=1 Tax=Aphis glycines TaxID=307491 RepID=A0A6G0TYW1_APHGL|nr:hypothetical protein AGLY_003536 [Aphis glycines]